MLTRIKIISLMCFAALFINGCAGNKTWSQTFGMTSASPDITRVQMTSSPHSIAVMLPLKGKGELALTSQAIHNGLLAAYYSTPQQSGIDIKVIDTSSGDVGVLYQQAVTDGAEVIVGPLTKQEVEVMANANQFPVPIIALNTLDDYRYKVANNLYQFGLLPQDEAVQVATKMTQEQLKHVAVIAPESAWGDKIVAAFENVYEASGGQVIATLRYHVSQDLAGQICNFLANDATKLCVPQKHKSKKQKDPQEIMRRQDIDAIFLVATTPAQARQIVPLLKFYYAGDLPIYSISTIYSGTSKPGLDQDIDDINFCDMPWVLKNVDALSPELQVVHKQIITTNLWTDSFANYSKFYALGVDAYNLAVGLNALLNAPQSGINGASGTLYLDNFNHIYRELQWAKIKNGVVQGL
jgi:outer membrane PBP1 activator LpoA protein